MAHTLQCMSSYSGSYCMQVQKENSKLTKTNKELDLLLMDSLRKLDGEAPIEQNADTWHGLPLIACACSLACSFRGGIERAEAEATATADYAVPGIGTPTPCLSSTCTLLYCVCPRNNQYRVPFKSLSSFSTVIDCLYACFGIRRRKSMTCAS